MRASIQEQKGAIGVHEVAAKFERIGWGIAKNTDHDLGTDLYLAPRDERLFDLATIAGAQVKAGDRKYFREVVLDGDGDIKGWWYREPKRDHFDYWVDHHAPHFLVLHDMDNDISYWVLVTREDVQFLKKGAKIFVSADQTLDANHAEALVTAANSRPMRSNWEGSSWTGATNLSPTHVYRHALLVPRLIAPHPNLSVSAISAAQGLSLVVLGRTWRHLTHRDGGLPDLRAIDGTWTWDWQLVAGLHRFITSSTLQGLCDALSAATEPHQQAAAAAVLAAAQIEDGQAAAAVQTTSRLLERDRLGTVDHAWVRLHHARALFETGALEEARSTAFDLINLSSHAPSDITAAAVSGAAANLLFAVADWDEFDFGKAISTSDTAAAWWRQQVTAHGLGHQADAAFQAWAHDESTASPADDAWDNLRAASVMAGVLGDHTAWRGALGKLARFVLSDGELSADAAQVRSALATLRLAGASKNVTTATRRLIATGAATVVKDLADSCHPARSTTTGLEADIALLTAAGDLLEPAHANSVAEWAMAAFDDPTSLTTKLHARFDVQSRLAGLLAQLVMALPEEQHPHLLGWSLAAQLETPGLSARALRDLVMAFPDETWTPELADVAAERADGDPMRLRYALLRVGARHRPHIRHQLRTEALAGEADALWALGPVTDFNDDFVVDLISAAEKGIEILLADQPHGRSSGAYVPADVLALLNIWHPAVARWEPLYSLLAAADEHTDLADTLDRLASQHDRLPAQVTRALAPHATRLADMEIQDAHRRLFHRDFRPAARHLRAAIECSRGPAPRASALLSLLAGDRHDRQSAALLCSAPEPFVDGVLATLSRDRDPHVRATAASTLTHRAARGDALGLSLVAALAKDPCLPVATAVASEAKTHPDAEVLTLIDELGAHPAGRIRAQIKSAKAGLGSQPR